MSVSSLPEWKQLLLERKRREEEERGRREKEEEQKFASMPAWKRGIIQRRKAKQETLGDRERERDACLLQVDVSRSPYDGLSDTDSSVTVNLGSEPSLSPDPGLWLDAEPKLLSQVSVETIVPVHENPFIRTQSAWRRGRDAEAGGEPEVKDRERDKPSPRGQDGEPARGRDIELKIERFRDLSEGREKDRSRDRSQGREHSRERSDKDKNDRKDSGKEQEFPKTRKDAEEKEVQPQPGTYSPLGPCLRTIRADNIIIIEQDSAGGDERRPRWRETERERERTEEDAQQGKRGMKMDLREILAGGGSVTEIRASEVLIIKPSTSPEERSPAAGKGGREEGETKSSADPRRDAAGRELRTDMSWLRDKEKERPWGQATVINKDERKDSLDDSVFTERGGRVSQLLSKFGEHPKPPSRSKSSDNFLHPGRCKYLLDEDEQEYEEMKADGKSAPLKGVPKRSFSFSDRVVSAKENGVSDEGYCERKVRERIHSDRGVTPWVDVASSRRESAAKIKLGCARLLDRDRFGKFRDAKTEDEKRGEAETCGQHRSEAKKTEPVDKRAAEKVVDADGDAGFTVASVKNTEGISFARRVPIRQDVRARSERETKRAAAERSLEREQGVEKEAEPQGCHKGDGGAQNAAPPESSYAPSAPAEPVGAEGPYRHESAFTECSGLLCTVKERPPHRGPEWGGAAASRGAYLAHSVLSQHTEELISKIEKIGETTVYGSERADRAYKAAHEATEQDALAEQAASESLDAAPRSPKRSAPAGVPHDPLEIQIPRTVFYVAEETAERKKPSEGQDREGGREVERRDSWRVGKPLSRIESLREKIRQRELEKLRQRGAQDEEGGGGGGRDAAGDGEAPTAADRYDERGSEAEKEWEVTCLQRMLVDGERAQEDAAAQTSAAAFDVTQEVGVSKSCPQLPVTAPHSQAARGGEATSAAAVAAASEGFSGSFPASEDEDDPLKHVEEELRRLGGRQKLREDDKEEEGKESSEDQEVEEYTSHLDPAHTLSSSPPHPNSLAAMSRIYNLETVGSRSGLCLRDRTTADISSSVHLLKVKPLAPNSQQADGRAFAAEEICGVQAIQRQIEHFQLKEQEVLKSCSSPKREAKGQPGPRALLKPQSKDEAKAAETPKVSPPRVSSPTSHLKQSATSSHAFARSQSPDNSLKPSDCAPTPAPSPSSPSPSPSPSVSPSPSPSPTLFTIRSASGGPAKRGATITISPKKPPAGGGAAGSAPRPSPAGSSAAKAAASQQASEPGKKRYPAAEEIEVIGGYQSLEKSCLVKKGGTPKRGKVCFDEDQLEHVCEYPSETFMLAFNPHPHDMLRMEKLQGAGEAQDEEAEAEGGGGAAAAAAAAVCKGARNAGMAAAPRLRVDESCP